jgi:hypothetical protein
MDANQTTIKIGKLDAAKRQLETAITLWFNDGDPVSVHALAFAAYEVIHAVSKKRDPNRRDLLFDTLIIKDEYRGEFNIRIKKYAYFFKHGDREPDAIIDFAPIMSDLYLMFAILGLELCGERKSASELAFMWWLYIQKPHWLTAAGGKLVADNIPSDDLIHLRSRPKMEFLEAFRVARAKLGR